MLFALLFAAGEKSKSADGHHICTCTPVGLRETSELLYFQLFSIAEPNFGDRSTVLFSFYTHALFIPETLLSAGEGLF